MWYSNKEMKRRDEAFKARTHNLSKADKKIAMDEDLEKGWKEVQDCVLSFKAGRNILEGGRFDTLSLGTWLEIIKATDREENGIEIPYIPITMVGMVKDIQQVLKHNKMPLDIPKELLQYEGMVRLDSCGSAVIKAQMSYRGGTSDSQIKGAYLADGKWYFHFDERTANSVLSYVGQIYPDGSAPQPLWWRPWIKAASINVPRERSMGRGVDSWPMEWRVYIQNGKISAISNYYIQAPIDLEITTFNEINKDDISRHLNLVIRQVNAVLNFMKERGIQPSHPRYIGGLQKPDDVSFTMDFMSLPDGPVFLEAGPRVPVDENNIPVTEWGAHPCLFMDKPVSGVAFSSNTVVDLKQFE